MTRLSSTRPLHRKKRKLEGRRRRRKVGGATEATEAIFIFPANLNISPFTIQVSRDHYNHFSSLSRTNRPLDYPLSLLFYIYIYNCNNLACLSRSFEAMLYIFFSNHSIIYLFQCFFNMLSNRVTVSMNTIISFIDRYRY